MSETPDPLVPATPAETDAAFGLRLIALLERRLEQLVQKAHVLVDDYWARHLEASSDRPASDRGYIRVRCRLHHNTLLIEWFRQQYTRTINPQTGRRYVFSDHFRKGRGCHYREDVFRRSARPWELPLILEYERHFAELRRRAAALVKLRQQIRQQLLKPAHRSGLAAGGDADV
ncbi:MAG: conjugative transfer protein MobI(A/C) [Candidatus Competibacteraceae bacterium]